MKDLHFEHKPAIWTDMFISNKTSNIL